MLKKTVKILVIVIIAGLSGVLADRYFFPYLASTKPFQKYDWLKKSTDNVTVINKTEQIYVKEETSINKIGNQVATSVVSIVSYQDIETKVTSAKPVIRNTVKSGTGMIVTSDGLIMTYATAILSENAKYKVLTNNGNTLDAELWGIDSYSNLAFLKVNASNLTVVSLADSSQIKAGEKIIALGDSDSRGQDRLNLGVISNFNPTLNMSGKTISQSEKLEGVFELSPTMSQEFIGSPIIDYSGQVIGIMGAIELDGEQVSFAIPSNKIKTVLERAIQKQLDQNYQLGIYYVPITPVFALGHNLSTDKGALLYSPSGQQGLAIIAASPAAQANLRIYDIITKVNGEEVNVENSLPDLLYKYKKGATIELTILRDGQELKVSVTL